MKVIIMRGISGCGKSTWIKNNHPNAVVTSADYAFRKPDGTYDFSDRGNRIHEAHKACYQTFIKALANKEPLVVVDNGNIHVWEIAPYVMPAESFSYEVEILTIECDPDVAISRKDWNAPEEIRSSAQLITEEEKHFPEFMKQIHNKLRQDEL